MRLVMIDGSPNYRNRIADYPTNKEIADQTAEIRSEWSDEIAQKRIVSRRFDREEVRAQAHLRFIQFLIERSQAES